jgi:hypothetical protein
MGNWMGREEETEAEEGERERGEDEGDEKEGERQGWAPHLLTGGAGW